MPCSRKISKAFFIFSAQSTPRSLFRVVVVTITTYLVFTATFRNSNHAAVGGKCDTLLNLNGCRKHLRKKRHHRKDHHRKKHTNTSLSISNTNKSRTPSSEEMSSDELSSLDECEPTFNIEK